MKTVIDVSLYQDVYTLEKFKLLVDNGVSGVIIRAGCSYLEDRMLKTWVDWCESLNIPYGFYWYFYPETNSTQAELFIQVSKKYPNAESLWIDVEEHVGSASFLNAFYKTEFMKVYNAFPDKVVGNYSGGWVLDSYIPEFYKWAKNYPYWNAHYVKYFWWWQQYIMSLGGQWDSYTKTVSISNLQNIMDEIEKHPVKNPIGFDKVDMWQCITFIPFTELTSGQKHLDWNICYEFEKLFPSPEPPIEPPVIEPPIIEKIKRGWKRLFHIV